MALIKLSDQLDSLGIELILFNFHFLKDIHSGVRVDKLLGIQSIDEAPDGILLLYLMELHNAVFPNLVQLVELDLLVLHDFAIELVALFVFGLVLGFLVCDLLFH